MRAYKMYSFIFSAPLLCTLVTKFTRPCLNYRI